MRLQLFHMIDETASLLQQRQEYYQGCANELQALFREVLGSEALLGVHVRVKSEKSLREKILRKRLYLQYDTKYDLLSNLTDLVGIRVECRFMREEKELYGRLQQACTTTHEEGTFSIPQYPTVRFLLSSPQPETQNNGFTIYRIDGKYHKNGVTVPFELQIKSLVHVFWAEVEHQLIYKNNAYVPMDDFMKKLLYSNYNSLKQMDSNLQLIYDNMQARSNNMLAAPQNTNLQTILAKIISDIFLNRMQGQMGFSLRLNHACDTLARYFLVRFERDGKPINQLIGYIRTATNMELVFDDALELGGAYYSDDPFRNTIGNHLAQQLNINYDWNVFFRMLFTLEAQSGVEPMSSFSGFVDVYCGSFQEESLYLLLPEESRPAERQRILACLGELLTSHDDISILYEATVGRLGEAIKGICAEGCKEHARIHSSLHTALEAH